ncbi:Nadh-ubiquinone oxidoreductase chain [Thalictrum thalictroides]|uniref:Nadh-ubiquinone oxidoreductase chain n=1 Tax=Thalictrum thalictroides TaxID=46969 RepID=A0A7J6VA14_THATH|nr:Nadh-ubiquinone oxidoreductase chain [Thalictrum thalictroides]
MLKLQKLIFVFKTILAFPYAILSSATTTKSQLKNKSVSNNSSSSSEKKRKSSNITKTMITRSNLAEQLREYQIRSKNEWASVSFFTSTSSNLNSSRVDVVSVIWELIILAFLVFSAISLYFRHMWLAFILVFFTMLLLLCMKITKQVRLNKKKKRRMLLPLSM